MHGEDGGGVGERRGGKEMRIWGLGRKTERWVGKGREIKGPRGVAVRVMERCSDRMRNGVQKEWEEVSRNKR